MRGRTRNKGPNPLTRSYESNGPDVKIRGTAQHVADKYSQLARDAQASGDPVAAENYFQHAEHYYRLIATAQEQLRQQFPNYQRDEEGEEGEEEGGFGGQSPNQGDEFGEPPNFPQGGYEPRGERQGGGRFDRNDRQNRQRFDRNGERFDRQNGYDRQNGGEQRQDRQNGYDRQGGGEQRYERQDRPERAERQERPDRPERRERFDRPREDRGPRDGYAAREGRPERDNRRDARPAHGAEEHNEEALESNGLPAFLTTPVRPPATVEEVAESAGLTPPAAAPEEAAPTGVKPRRRRTTRKAEPAPENVDETAEGA